jgi:hypothetical protein
VGGCSGKKEEKRTENKRTEDKKEERTADDKKGGTEKQTEPDVRVTAKQLAAEFKQDPKKMAEKYKGVVEVSGTVNHLYRYVLGTYGLSLEGVEGGEWVECEIDGSKNPWRTVTPGQTAKLRGKWEESSHPKLVECKIVEVSGTRTPTLTPQEISKLWDSDWEVVKKKFQYGVILEGEISKVEKVEMDRRTITFKTPPGGKPVYVQPHAVTDLYGKELKAGDTVKLLVSLPLNPKEEYVFLLVDFLLD